MASTTRASRRVPVDPRNDSDTIQDALKLLMDGRMMPLVIEVMAERKQQQVDYSLVDSERAGEEGEAEWINLLYERVSKAHLSYEGKGTPGRSLRDRAVELAAMSFALIEMIDQRKL